MNPTAREEPKSPIPPSITDAPLPGRAFLLPNSPGVLQRGDLLHVNGGSVGFSCVSLPQPAAVLPVAVRWSGAVGTGTELAVLERQRQSLGFVSPLWL